MGLSGPGGGGGGLLMPEPGGGVFGSQQAPLFGDTNLPQPGQISDNALGQPAALAEKQQQQKVKNSCWQGIAFNIS